MKRKKVIITSVIVIAVLVLAAAGTGAYAWKQLKVRPWIKQTVWIYVHPDETQASIDAQLQASVDGGISQFWVDMANRITGFGQKLDEGKLAGAYKLTEGMPLVQALRIMSLRMQTPVKVTFIGLRTVPEVAGRLSAGIMADSASVLNAIYSKTFLNECQSDSANIGCFLLPDTYEVYWDISPERLTQRLLSEYRKFWNDERLAKASDLKLTPREINIICSIAEEETADRHERGIVARLYWNRLQRGMLLQADPTVKFAVGDFKLRRILNKHLEVESPYNTYKVAGLPPSPIRVVEKRTVEAFLNSNEHPYLYMCAKEDFSGLHNFATTLSQHNANAARYHNALKNRGIR